MPNISDVVYKCEAEFRKRTCKDCDYYVIKTSEACLKGLWTYIKRDDGKRSFATCHCSQYHNDRREIYKGNPADVSSYNRDSYREKIESCGYAVNES